MAKLDLDDFELNYLISGLGHYFVALKRAADKKGMSAERAMEMADVEQLVKKLSAAKTKN